MQIDADKVIKKLKEQLSEANYQVILLQCQIEQMQEEASSE